jgi:GxxExxY protein
MAENGRKPKAQFDYAADHWGGTRSASTFGSRLAESAYEACPAHERRHGGYRVGRQKPLPVVSTDVKLDCGHRLDLAVENEVIVEVQAIERLTPIHDAPLLSCLRVGGKSVGLIINFPVRLLNNSLKGMVNEFPDSARSAVSKKAENRSEL